MEEELLDNFQLEGPAQTSDISYEFIEMDPDLKYIEAPVKVENFKANMNKRNFELEFGLLRRLTENKKQVERLKEYNPEVTKLNRYPNILPCNINLHHAIINFIIGREKLSIRSSSFLLKTRNLRVTLIVTSMRAIYL